MVHSSEIVVHRSEQLENNRKRRIRVSRPFLADFGSGVGSRLGLGLELGLGSGLGLRVGLGVRPCLDPVIGGGSCHKLPWQSTTRPKEYLSYKGSRGPSWPARTISRPVPSCRFHRPALHGPQTFGAYLMRAHTFSLPSCDFKRIPHARLSCLFAPSDAKQTLDGSVHYSVGSSELKLTPKRACTLFVARTLFVRIAVFFSWLAISIRPH